MFTKCLVINFGMSGALPAFVFCNKKLLQGQCKNLNFRLGIACAMGDTVIDSFVAHKCHKFITLILACLF